MKLTKKFYLAAGLSLALALSGCSKEENKTSQNQPEETKTVQQAQPEKTAPSQAHDARQNEPVELKGKVVETFDSGGYTYLQLDNGSKKIWVAISQTKVTVGDEISLKGGVVMPNFYSKTLDRTFEEIIFSSGIQGGAAEAHASAMKPQGMGGMGSGFAGAMKSEGGRMAMEQVEKAVSGGSAGAIVPFHELEVEKAEGENGRTVEEIYLQAADLDGKKVKIRGNVVKISHNIMGKNWLHIQDGTGNPMKNSHDLVVTTAAAPEVQSTVLVEGTLAKDKDFGAGYQYLVIVEDAVVE
ncbi:MAG: DNA-binding protein [Thermodesulfobacteriota bacterium]|nr:DNA-binding protein [Thermodesulfobacteriota bacterium]